MTWVPTVTALEEFSRHQELARSWSTAQAHCLLALKISILEKLTKSCRRRTRLDCRPSSQQSGNGRWKARQGSKWC